MAAQRATVWLDATAASARPPAGITAQTALYGIAGLSARIDAARAGAFDLSVTGGRSSTGASTGWAQGEAGWSLNGASRHLAWGVRASAFGLDYTRPFSYRAAGGTFEPRLSTTRQATTLSLQGDFELGTWARGALDSLAVRADSAPTGSLGVAGGAASAARRFGPVWLEVGGEAYQGALDGWFAGPFASARLSALNVQLALSARSWSTPAGRDNGFEASAEIPVGDRAALRAGISRTQLDPLYGTPGSLGASVGVLLRLASSAPAPVRLPLAELREATSGGRVARFRLHAPAARTVALAGDFTDWRPRSMTRKGPDWVIELTIPRGVHHFAFLVNGQEWTVPREAPGVSTDEWGRKNATLVVDS